VITSVALQVDANMFGAALSFPTVDANIALLRKIFVLSYKKLLPGEVFLADLSKQHKLFTCQNH